MATRHPGERDEAPAGENPVERSLDDFIARANTTLPAPTDTQAATIRQIKQGARRGKRRDGGTMVVLGSEKPLPEVTEIVSRMPRGELEDAPRRGWFSLRLAFAFIAGAAAVLILTRLLSGDPEPVKPVVTMPPPPIVVQPMPVPVVTPVPEPAPPPSAAVAAPVEAEIEARPAPARKRPRPARKPTASKPSGLVDPFAQ